MKNSELGSLETIWIWFDMDGTIYDLYKVENWLNRLRSEDEFTYNEKNKHRRQIRRIRETIRFIRNDVSNETVQVNFGIISWLSMGANVSYQLRITGQKYEWTKQNIPELLEDNAFYCIPYGCDKGLVALAHEFSVVFDGNPSKTTHILIDDNKNVRADWRKKGSNFKTIDAKRGFIADLKRVCAKS